MQLGILFWEFYLTQNVLIVIVQSLNVLMKLNLDKSFIFCVLRMIFRIAYCWLKFGISQIYFRERTNARKNSYKNSLGEIKIPLNTLITSGTVNKWYCLNPPPENIRSSIQLKTPSFLYDTPKIVTSHKLIENSSVLKTCLVCNGVILGSNYTCRDCNFVCHAKCRESAPKSCGSEMGALKIKINLTVILKTKKGRYGIRIGEI